MAVRYENLGKTADLPKRRLDYDDEKKELEMAYLFTGFPPLLRILVVGTLSYFSLLVILHLSGQRMLGKMQTFDIVVAVTLGSTYGRLLTAHDTPFAEALTAFVLLATLHYVVSLLKYRCPAIAQIFTTKPLLVYYQGRYQRKAMRTQFITEQELLTAVRMHGCSSISEVEAIVLESDGSITVLKRDPGSDFSSLNQLEPRAGSSE